MTALKHHSECAVDAEDLPWCGGATFGGGGVLLFFVRDSDCLYVPAGPARIVDDAPTLSPIAPPSSFQTTNNPPPDPDPDDSNRISSPPSMASQQVDAPQAAAGEQSLPSRPAKQPKDKAPKGGKNAGLEVSGGSRERKEMRAKGEKRRRKGDFGVIWVL